MTDKTDHVQGLNQYLLDVLTLNTAQAFSIITMVERILRQRDLFPRYEACDILFEAYLRSHDAIKQNKEIRDYRGWIKATCLNIIREKSRNKMIPYDPQAPVLWNLSDSSNQQEQKEHRQKLILLWRAFEAFRQEDPFAAKLMDWKFLESISWEEIQVRLQEEGLTITVTALRQRGRRAKKSIRKIYHRLEEEAEGITTHL